MVKTTHPRLSIVRQCMLLGIGRSSFYYAAMGESPRNLELMRRIDEQFLERPFFGARQVARRLRLTRHTSKNQGPDSRQQQT